MAHIVPHSQKYEQMQKDVNTQTHRHTHVYVHTTTREHILHKQVQHIHTWTYTHTYQAGTTHTRCTHKPADTHARVPTRLVVSSWGLDIVPGYRGEGGCFQEGFSRLPGRRCPLSFISRVHATAEGKPCGGLLRASLLTFAGLVIPPW